MSLYNIDVALLKKIFKNGAINLKNNYQEVDHLNVFPVPDGDTGTNMQMTISSGLKEIESKDYTTIKDLSKAMSKGCLMGARGNSGVILSQFFSGLAEGLSKYDSECNVLDFKNALNSAQQKAYKAVLEPVEGTILTVVRESIENTINKDHKTIKLFLDDYINEAKKSLNNTPNILPVLKEANVVDSGGAGFVKVIEGFLLAVEGITLESKDSNQTKSINPQAMFDTNDIKYAYCTEFISRLNLKKKFDLEKAKNKLIELGDSLVFVLDEDILKVHIHTNKPGKVIDLFTTAGTFVNLKIENMKLQHNEFTLTKDVQPKEERKEYAIIAVCSGDGIADSFKDLGVSNVINGGQTMNPSCEDFVNEIKKANAKNIIILPNNKNIIMAAEQASKIVEDSKVFVLKTRSIAEGYASLMSFDSSETIEVNVKNMNQTIKSVTSGEITYSIRDTNLSGVEIKNGDFIGINNGKITVSEDDRINCFNELIKQLIKDESSIVTIFYGEDINAKELEIVKELLSTYDNVETEFIYGKQSIYSYIICVE